jgi:predicted porin
VIQIVATPQRIGGAGRLFALNLCQTPVGLVQYTQLPNREVGPGFSGALRLTLEYLYMKKTLIALAALAATSASFAQVTIYGTLDGSYGANTTSGQTTDIGMRSSYDSTSKIGFRGTEDLGGGMAAGFNFETGGLNMGTGGTAMDTSRASNLSLSGGFGKVTLGRIVSVGTQGNARFDLNGVAGSSAYVATGLSPTVWYGSSRRSAQFQYSIAMGGLSVVFGDTLASDNAAQNNRASLAVGYTAGPLDVSLVGEGASTNAAGARTAWALGAKYNLGVATVAANFVQSEFEKAGQGGATYGSYGQGFGLGVSVPLGAATVGLQYARNNEARADGSNRNAYELFAKYNLSKRTQLYVDYVGISADTVGSNGSYALGVIHQF